LWVANLQTNQIRWQGDLTKLRALLHINRIALLLALGGGYDGASATIVGAID